jgi:hypothetical protein
MWLAGAG